MEHGHVEALWLKRFKRGPMDAVQTAELIEKKGLVGNANQRGRRQVTLLDADVWEQVMQELGATLAPSVRRANILVRGVDLARCRGQILRLGNCRVQIFTEAKPCERMDEVLPGLKSALYPNWQGGACGEVITGGTLHVGDVAVWEVGS